MNCFRTFSFLFFFFCLSAISKEEPGSRIPEREYHHLFSILRSINANVLVYEACLLAEGRSCAEPIQAHWIMRTKDGRLEPLTSFERANVYGVALGEVHDDRVLFFIKTLKDRVITATRKEDAGKWEVRATLPIAGENCNLEEVFVQTRKGGLIPKVQYLEVRGRQVSTGTLKSERIEGRE